MRTSFDSNRAGLFCGVLALALAVGTPAHAQYSLYASAGIGAGNNGSVTGPGSSSAAGSPVSYNGSLSFTGMDSSGSQQTMTLVGTASASAQYGSLHAATAATIINPYYNASNPVYLDTSTGTVNANGSPSNLSAGANAQFTDVFTYTGFQGTGYKVRYVFNIDGGTAGSFYNAAYLTFTAGPDPQDTFLTSTSLANVSTKDHQVLWGVSTTIHTNFDVYDIQDLQNDFPNYTEGQTLTGSASYSDTATLSGIQIVDSNGNQVNGWGFTSASGTRYNLLGGQYGTVTAVPEPGSLALLTGAGLTGAILLRKRRSRP